MTILVKSTTYADTSLVKSQVLNKVLCNYRIILKKGDFFAISVIIIYLWNARIDIYILSLIYFQSGTARAPLSSKIQGH